MFDASDETSVCRSNQIDSGVVAPLYALVNNAGGGASRSFLGTRLADWRAVMGVDSDMHFLRARIAMEAMRPVPVSTHCCIGSIADRSSALPM